MRFGEKDRVIKRLLIVEDEPLVAFDNEHALVEAGYHIVATVDRVAAATAALHDGLVDLALVDVRLAGGDNGMDVARVALERRVPVLIVTATCPAEARALAIGCLAKPHSTRTLRAAIRVVEERLRGATPKRLPAGLALFDAEG